MKTFADTAARTWAIIVNVAAVKRVRELLQVNLLEIADQKAKLLERLVDDPCLLCDILFCLVKPEADAKGVSDEDFGRGLAGDALGAATDALLSEIADFFPKGRREIMQRILAKLTALQDKATSLALTKLDDPELDRQMEAELKAAMDQAFEKPGPTSSTSDAGSSPESPASNPEGTPSAS
jgi:hypothetical protein